MPTHHQGSPADMRALDAFIKLVRASGSVLARTGRHLASEGLTVGQFGILETLLHLGPLHQCELARKHLQSGGHVTMIVDNLERAGLVRRERLAADRRYVRVCLTAAGKARITALFPDHVQQIREQMDVLTADELDQLGRLCRKLGLHAAAESEAPSSAKPVPTA